MLRAALFLACAIHGSGHKLAVIPGKNEADPSKLRPARSSTDFGQAQFVQLAARIIARQDQGDPLQNFQSLLKRLTAEETTTAVPVLVAQPAAPVPVPEQPSRKIPKKLLFNHKVNLLKIPDAKMNSADKLLRENILHIMSIFPEASQEDVHFWNDEDCQNGQSKIISWERHPISRPSLSRAALNLRATRESEALSVDFASEQVGMVKSDICRLAMMYTLGGYYFDTDILVTPELKAQIAPETTFATVRAAGSLSATFFQAFLAPLRLEEFKAWYDKLRAPGVNQAQLRVSTANGNIGTALLRQAYDKWSQNGPTPKVSHPGGLFASQLELRLLPGHSGFICDYAVVNKPTSKVVLYSRVYDSHHHQECSEEVKLMRSMGSRASKKKMVAGPLWWAMPELCSWRSTETAAFQRLRRRPKPPAFERSRTIVPAQLWPHGRPVFVGGRASLAVAAAATGRLETAVQLLEEALEPGAEFPDGSAEGLTAVESLHERLEELLMQSRGDGDLFGGVNLGVDPVPELQVPESWTWTLQLPPVAEFVGPVEIRWNEGCERGLFATRQIFPGEVLLVNSFHVNSKTAIYGLPSMINHSCGNVNASANILDPLGDAILFRAETETEINTGSEIFFPYFKALQCLMVAALARWEGKRKLRFFQDRHQGVVADLARHLKGEIPSTLASCYPWYHGDSVYPPEDAFDNKLRDEMQELRDQPKEAGLQSTMLLQEILSHTRRMASAIDCTWKEREVAWYLHLALPLYWCGVWCTQEQDPSLWKCTLTLVKARCELLLQMVLAWEYTDRHSYDHLKCCYMLYLAFMEMTRLPLSSNHFWVPLVHHEVQLWRLEETPEPAQHTTSTELYASSRLRCETAFCDKFGAEMPTLQSARSSLKSAERWPG
eukprot:s5086_g2.t1